ncbi:MAG: hypothetical protein ACXAEU_14545 [Candidatus Hodarchaeales archaeon]
MSEYLDGFKQNTFNTSIISINETHWDMKCDYSITQDWFLNPIDSSFFSSVNRTSINNYHNASNYYNWQGFSQEINDYWIDASNYYDGYSYESGGITLTVTEVNNFYSDGLGDYYDAWKISGIDPGIGLISIWYDSSGLFLSLTFHYISTFWYNLTLAELGEIPLGYTGPTISHVSPSNGSIRPQGAVIELQLDSPFGVTMIYYQWDSSTNVTSDLSTIMTTIPAADGSHDLYITAVDNIGLSNFHHFVFITNNDVPGFSLINHNNDSRIQGSSTILIAITSGNGSLTYNWDGGSNITVAEGTPINFLDSNDEGIHVLTVYANSTAGISTSSKFVFTVDNTPPGITVQDFINGSVIKDTVNLRVIVSESSNLTYNLNNTSFNSFYAEEDQNYTLTFSNLANGSYQLIVQVVDEANNTAIIKLTFSVHVSSFNWNWHLAALTPLSLNVVDASGESWFELTLVSKTDQNFNLTHLPDDVVPEPENLMLSIVQFTCEKPEDIILMTFAFAVNESMITNAMITVQKWVYWDDQSDQWVTIPTAFNHLSFTWEATHEGKITYFSLVSTDEKLDIGSITDTRRFEAPSFGVLSIITLLVLHIARKIMYRNKTKKRCKKCQKNE